MGWTCMTEEKEPTKYLFIWYGMRDFEELNKDTVTPQGETFHQQVNNLAKICFHLLFSG